MFKKVFSPRKEVLGLLFLMLQSEAELKDYSITVRKQLRDFLC